MKGLMLLPLLAVLVVNVCYVEASPAVERDAEETLLNLLARVLDDQHGKSTKESDIKKDQGAAKEEQMKKNGRPGQVVEKADNGMEDILEERQATYELRLVNGANQNDQYEGRVEICETGTPIWGTVCDDGWGNDEASVVCRQLGLSYSSATAYSYATFGQGSGSIFLDDVVCTGAETEITSCSNRGWGRHDCQHSEDAGVRCEGFADGDLRLGGGYDACGRVEVFYNGEWGTICHDFWDSDDAKVVCRQLGLPWSNALGVDSAFYGPGIGEVWLDNVSCDGSEERLDQCESLTDNKLPTPLEWGNNNCDHSMDAVVFCR